MNTETNYAEHFYADISNDIDSLKKNVNENPFSSVAQFLLLYSYKKNNDPSFEQYARQAAIYFNNFPWIEYQLLGNNTDQSSQLLLSTETPEEVVPVNEQIIQNSNQQPGIENEETKEASNISDHIQTLGEDEIPGTTSIVEEQINQNSNQQPWVENEETKEASNISNKIQTLGEDEIKETTSIVDEQISQNPDQQLETVEEETKGASDISDKTQTLGEDDIQETTSTVSEQISQNPNQQSQEEIKVTSNILDHIQTLGVDEIQDSTKAPNISDEIRTLGVDEVPETTFTEPIIQSPNQESENEEELVAFEPLHTVDYFASQGIKISEEALENDHLGQQVKSFTAWLKSMKKLHPGQLPEQNEVIEKIIQSSAEASNQNANVLTEAMAEVLIKQGKKEKAVEMYQKLSLMNPSKSTYFAAKIESLKTI